MRYCIFYSYEFFSVHFLVKFCSFGLPLYSYTPLSFVLLAGVSYMYIGVPYIGISL